MKFKAPPPNRPIWHVQLDIERMSGVIEASWSVCLTYPVAERVLQEFLQMGHTGRIVVRADWEEVLAEEKR